MFLQIYILKVNIFPLYFSVLTKYSKKKFYFFVCLVSGRNTNYTIYYISNYGNAHFIFFR